MSSPWNARNFAFAAAAIATIAGAWYLSRGEPTASEVEPAVGVEQGPIEVVGDATELAAGSDVRVYWRVVGAEYSAWFEVTASAGPDGKGAVTGEQIFARLEQLELPGSLAKAGVRDVKPGAPLTDPRAALTTVTGSAAEQYRGMVRRDAQGRSVLFVDVEVGPADSVGTPHTPDPGPDE